jgi:uncharacterized surface protein with fasciclin (FAS1) repeats
MALLHLKQIKKWMHCFPLLSLLAMISCVEGMGNGIYKVSESYMIDEYIESNQDLSKCYELIQMSTFSGMLHGYGSYTIFAPTNEAFDTYLTSIGKTDISQLTQLEADSIIKYHVLRDSVKTTDMEDGRLPSPTISGKYLTDKTMSDDAGNIYIQINRQGKITLSDISCDNGLVHVVNAVMTPPKYNILGGIESLPDSLFSVSKYLTLKYSKFCTDSMSLDSLEANWFTFFAQDNQSYIDLEVGITQKMIEDGDMSAIQDSLLVRLRENQPTETSDVSLMNQFADYHFIKSLKYVSDLLYASSLESAVVNQSLSFKLTGETLLVNYFEFGSTVEPGVELYRESDYSDLSCSNGVIHYIAGGIEIKSRSAYRIYWDLADQPENQALKNFRKSGCTATYASGDLSEVTWGGSLLYDVTYSCYSQSSTSIDQRLLHVYADYMRFRFSPNVNSWFEWKTPMLVAGTYKMWLCWRTETQTTFRTIFRQEDKDDQVMNYVFNLNTYPSISLTDEAMLAMGQKQYTAKYRSGYFNSMLLGTIIVESTGRHTLRFECLTGRSGETSWDMIQFIPINEDQIWPRVDGKGKWIYEDTPDCEIYPYVYRNSKNYQGDCIW